MPPSSDQKATCFGPAFPSSAGSTLALEVALPLGLVILVIAAFLRLLWADFVNFDDYIYVKRNPRVEGGLTVDNVRWAFITFSCSNWHPLTWLSLQLDETLFGSGATAFHFTNIVLHGANALLLLVALRRITGSLWGSWLVAAFFAVHPLHVESVAWVAERKDVLSGLFGMLALVGYGKYVQRPSLLRFFLVLLWFSLGLLAKPMLVTLPFIFLLLDYWPFHRLGSSRAFLEKLPFLILVCLSCAITFIAQSEGGATKSLKAFSFACRLANAALAYVAYLCQTFWPQSLAVFYPLEYRNWG